MDKRLPFQEVKVLEWTQAATGPWVGRCFADYGAEVIKIESTKFPDFLRCTLPYKDNIPGPDRAPFFLLFNTGKKSLTLDIKKPRGREIFMKLVSWADIVLQNQRPGLMKQMGLGYEELKKIKKDIILLDISIAGQEGPIVGIGGFGPSSMAQSGQFYYYRFPNGEPLMPGFTATADVIGPLFVAIASIAALEYKRKTGRGQHIDISQLEPIVHFLGPAVLDYTVNNRIQQPVGNRSPSAAPHNVFKCKGDDRWCTIAVCTDEEWKSFCNVLGKPKWRMSPKFAILSARKENEDELEKLVNEWTMNYTPMEVMIMMQEAGVPAGVVQNTQDIVEFDPQVKARELLPKRVHPIIGECLHTRWPFVLPKTPGEIRTAPCLGEHNYQICTEILGMSDEEFIELVNSEILS